MKKILLFRHERQIDAPYLTHLLSEMAIPYQLIKVDNNDVIPRNLAHNVGGLVFLSGGLRANDSCYWLVDETRLIKQAHQLKMPVLAHGLGAQLISKALGGKAPLMMAKKAISWQQISFLTNQTALNWRGKIPHQIKMMLWHHDELTMPPGASPLYADSNGKNQAFIKDNMLAVSHIESSEQMKDNTDHKMPAMQALSESFYLKWLRLVYPQKTNADIFNTLHSHLKSGSCLCGSVVFFLKYPRFIVNCHCQECRKFHGNYAAFTKVKLKDICIFGEQQLNWHQLNKNQAKRGFCSICGASLFWQPSNGNGLCVSAGALDAPTQLQTTKNIYTDYASDFYALNDKLEKYPASMKKQP